MIRLLAKLTGLSDLWQQLVVFGAMLAFALVCAYAGVQTWRVHSLRADLAEAQGALAAAAADLRTETQNVTALRAQLAQQNAAVQALERQAKAATDRAELAAAAARKRAPPPAFKSAGEFNAWLSTRMGGG